MADISDINSAQTVKIVGADVNGVEQTPVQSTANGAIHTNLRNDAGTEIATATNPLYVTEKYTHGHITGATTTLLKSGSGYLKRVSINRPTNGTWTFYDNITATGTPIITITGANGVAPTFLEYGFTFTTGLTVVTTGANTDLSIMYL